MIRFALVLAIASCSSHGNDKKVTMSTNECRAAVEAFASGDPKRLRGLPANCSLDDIRELIDPQRSYPSSLGDPGTGYNVHEIKGTKAMAWIKSNRVALLHANEPSHAEADYLAALGPPEAKLDFTWQDTVRPNSDLLWLAKGISLASSPDFKGVLRVAVFAPTTLDEYKRSLRYFDVSRDIE